MSTLAFWQATGERAVKTLAQTLIALIGATAINLTAISWLDDLGIAATAALLSVLTSIVSAGVGNPGPSLASETLTPPGPPVAPPAPPAA